MIEDVFSSSEGEGRRLLRELLRCFDADTSMLRASEDATLALSPARSPLEADF